MRNSLGPFAQSKVAAVALVGGALFGAALGVLGMRLTKFEQTAEGLFYTPSAHPGIAIGLLRWRRRVTR